MSNDRFSRNASLCRNGLLGLVACATAEDGQETFTLNLDMCLTPLPGVETSRPLAADLERVREEERIRLARAVHDDLGQTLTGLKMDLSWLRRRLAETCPGDQLAPMLQKTETMIALADQAILTVRRLATELRPVILDEFGLTPAIEWQAREFEKRTEIRCELNLARIELKGECAIALYRILQEALTNVLRHAAATEVRLALFEEGAVVVLEIADNGKGISDAALHDRRSLGLLGMRERAAIVGGTLRVQRLVDHGTCIVARIPHPAAVPGNAERSPAEEGQR